MIKELRAALKTLPEIATDIRRLADIHRRVQDAIQAPSALEAYKDRLEVVERQYAAILDQVQEILDEAVGERKQARNADERMRTKEARVNEAIEHLEGLSEGEGEEPDYGPGVPPVNAPGGEANGVLPVSGSVASKSEKHAAALRFKYGQTETVDP
ncbi:MAG: hypothetical protein V3S71_08370 [Acidobacteriota bacterium]